MKEISNTIIDYKKIKYSQLYYRQQWGWLVVVVVVVVGRCCRPPQKHHNFSNLILVSCYYRCGGRGDLSSSLVFLSQKNYGRLSPDVLFFSLVSWKPKSTRNSISTIGPLPFLLSALMKRSNS